MYARIGYAGDRNFTFLATNKKINEQREALTRFILSELKARGTHATAELKSGLVTVNGGLTVSVVVVRCFEQDCKGLLWKTKAVGASKQSDVSILARMSLDNQSILDYFVVPAADGFSQKIRIRQTNPLNLETYRFSSLNGFFDLCRLRNVGGIV